MEKYIKITAFPKNKENPFMGELLDSMTVTRRKKQLTSSTNGNHHMVVIDNEGQNVAHAGFYEIQEVDESQFIKVFSTFFAMQAGLSRTGREVLAYIMTLLEPRKDTIFIQNDKALHFLGYKTRKSLTTGIGDLLEKDVIARGFFDNEYFINPMIMFNGDRVTFAKTFVKKKVTQKSNENPDQMSLFDERALNPHQSKNPSFDKASEFYRRENPHLTKFTKGLEGEQDEKGE
jgi:hypothetical protein